MRALLFTTLLASAGCISAYEPPAISAPLLSKRNDVAVSVAAGRIKPSPNPLGYLGASAEVSWAPTDASRVLVNGSYARGYDRHDNGFRFSDQRIEAWDVSAAAGWGRTIGQAGRLEALGGFGVSQFDARYPRKVENGFDQVSGRLLRPFTQVHVGIVRASMEGAVGLRTTVGRADFDLVDGEPTRAAGLFVIAEPVLVARFGSRAWKVEIGLSTPAILATPKRGEFALIEAPGVRLSLGLRWSRLQGLISDERVRR